MIYDGYFEKRFHKEAKKSAWYLRMRFLVCLYPPPYRGSLLTGQYAHTHGLFLNDVTFESGCGFYRKGI